MAIFAKLVSDFEAMADRESHHRAQACRQRAEQLEGLAMAESYPERRKHFFDLATAYKNAANTAERQVRHGAARDSDFWSGTAVSMRDVAAANAGCRRRFRV